MFFGLSYLYGLTGTTSLPLMLERLQPYFAAGNVNALAVVGLALSLSGFLYKFAIFPFHFWTPDVYQGASNETAALVASLPKLGAVAVLSRFVGLVSPADSTIPTLLAVLATASMFYGNLVALVQTDGEAPPRLLRHRPRRLRDGRPRRPRLRRFRRLHLYIAATC
jgi:NADH-quinone oxidoreductase subunit N